MVDICEKEQWTIERMKKDDSHFIGIFYSQAQFFKYSRWLLLHQEVTLKKIFLHFYLFNSIHLFATIELDVADKAVETYVYGQPTWSGELSEIYLRLHR